VNRARVTRWLRSYGWFVPLVAMIVAGVLVASGLSPVSLGGHLGSPAAGGMSPGSNGSIRHYSWWDPRGWFGGGDAQVPHAQTIAVAGGPQSRPMPHQAAAPKPRRVAELTGKRTASARVYRLSDGRLQAVVSAGPMNYRDKLGHWRPISTAVRRISAPGYVYGNTTNTFRSYFGASPARLARFDAPGTGTLSLALDGARASRPQVAGNTVSYPGVASGASLQYQVTPRALKESITLAAPSAAPSYTYTVKVGGGLVPWSRGGQILFSRGSAGGRRR